MPAAKKPITLKIADGVLDGVEKHAYSTLAAEVGGMLMGSVRGKTTTIEGFIPALSASAEQVTLTFTHDVWEEILAKAAKEFPDKKIVGWYHTHPTFGIFLSEYDLFIQENFFNHAGNVALVIDPVQGLYGWFGKDASGKVEVFDEGKTTTGPKRSVDPLDTQTETSGQKPWKTLAIAVVALVVGGALGFGVTASQIPPDLSGALQTSRQETADARNDMRELVEDFEALLREPVIAYQVRPGDTFAKVVGMFYVDYAAGRRAVAEANTIAPTDPLIEGQWLWLPHPTAVAIEPLSAPDFFDQIGSMPPGSVPFYGEQMPPGEATESEEQ
jgi:proteasome lid subunit RPN8/RPN11